jgi:hypothetical protein
MRTAAQQEIGRTVARTGDGIGGASGNFEVGGAGAVHSHRP